MFDLLVFSMAWTNLRYTSFALDWISSKKRPVVHAASPAKEVREEKAETTERIEGNRNENAETTAPENISAVEEPPTENVQSAEDTVSENIPTIQEPHKEASKDSETPRNENETERAVSQKGDEDKQDKTNLNTAAEPGNEAAECAGSASDGVRDKDVKSEEVNVADLEVKYSLSDMLSYCFYLPYYFTGPITTYDEFYRQVCKQFSTSCGK